MIVSRLRAANVTGLCQHSARLVPGDAFIAYHGGQSDGRDFIADAVAHGAKAIVIDPEHLTPTQSHVLSKIAIPVLEVPHLIEKIPALADEFYDHPSQHLHIVAVTGTNGKSSIAHGLNQMYRALDVPVAMIGTLGIGTLDHCVDNPLTTPDSISLQRHLAEMYAAGIETVVMEASSHALDQGRLKTTDIHVAIFTNLTQDHLDYHKTLEAYGNAKAKLYKMDSVETVVINLDDEWCYAQLPYIASTKKVIGYTCKQKKSDRCDSIISAVPDGEGYRLYENDSDVFFEPLLIGSFNLSNLLAMIAAMRVDGFTLNVLSSIAEHVSGIPGRLECVSLPEDPRVIIDFAHTPDALEKAIAALRPTVRGKLWCIFGCGGDRDITKRAIMGKIAAKDADQVIITNDNPRNESPQKIADQILSGMPSKHHAQVILDREAAIRAAILSAHVEDTILIAGKGHEKTQIMAEIIMPFSDQCVARQVLKERRPK